MNPTPAEALELLKNATALAPLPRADHIRIMQALSVLEAAIKGEEKKDG